MGIGAARGEQLSIGIEGDVLDRRAVSAQVNICRPAEATAIYRHARAASNRQHVTAGRPAQLRNPAEGNVAQRANPRGIAGSKQGGLHQRLLLYYQPCRDYNATQPQETRAAMRRIRTTLAEIRQLELAHRQMIPAAYLDENQHVNVQYYVHLVEKGLVTLFERAGLGETYAAADEYGNFALEQHIRYLAELLVGEQVSVYIRLLELTPKRAYFMGFIINDSRKQLASAVELVQMNVDMRQRRGAPYPPAGAAALQALHARHERLDWSAPVCGVMRA
ncbi:MAG: thioesterase [Chloroflexi bacterium]|nr:thioesterase [Chloroflexota bacterium]MXX84704.1 thioesterase [Chloroflexota bacterium]MYE79948.1 thioesterase [Chloroflexota bacterium]MYH66506.1 thioesterase [Chloroflexota bacterium]